MTLEVWTERSGHSFGAFSERVRFLQLLPVVTGIIDITYTLIAGSLPHGLRLVNSEIVGTPYEVSASTEFIFCIRASDGVNVSDRTFKITIDGADEPIFTTAAGSLAIGLHKQYFVLDNTYVDYQIEAFDTDTAAGQHLSYFIEDDSGELPPGLVLTDDGRLIGLVKPAISITTADGNGWYDTGFYDVIAYDFGYRSTNGYDSYIYDTVNFDYNLPTFTPKKLNRNYQFTISITDGDSVARRTFSIFVVGDDYFRADNNTSPLPSGVFTADVSYLREPVWLTRSNLGMFRANNYLVLFLDTYDTGDQVVYNIEEAKDVWVQNHNYLLNDLMYDGGISYICLMDHRSTSSYDSTKWGLYGLPPGMVFDYANAEVYGRIPFQPAITMTYRFTINATRYSETGEFKVNAMRTFTVQLMGDVDSVITWDTPYFLNPINANYVSELKVVAISTVTNSVILYRVISGNLPSGLTLTLDGEIIGVVNQISNNETGTVGLTTFDYNKSYTTTFDGGVISFDRLFTFTIEARERCGYSTITREFKLQVLTVNQVLYSNIQTRPLLSIPHRVIWKNFINDNAIFTPTSIYRLNDANFGIQTGLSMLVYAGIATSAPAAYIGAMGLNHKKKRFQFGMVKSATAIVPGTHEGVYEVVYIEMIDALEPNHKRLPNMIRGGRLTPAITMDESNSLWSNTIDNLSNYSPDMTRPLSVITVDSTGYTTSDPNPTSYFPNSISNWQDRLSKIGDTERNYLPLWMRTMQPGTRSEIGFVLAVPLCYCKIGMAADIILNIKHSGFDFKLLDYTVDRFIIDSIDGRQNETYLIFRNDRITV